MEGWFKIPEGEPVAGDGPAEIAPQPEDAKEEGEISQNEELDSATQLITSTELHFMFNPLRRSEFVQFNKIFELGVVAREFLDIYTVNEDDKGVLVLGAKIVGCKIRKPVAKFTRLTPACYDLTFFQFRTHRNAKTSVCNFRRNLFHKYFPTSEFREHGNLHYRLAIHTLGAWIPVVLTMTRRRAPKSKTPSE